MARSCAAASHSACQPPVADLPVRRIVGAHHFVADVTLPYGRVLYDYNHER